MNAFKNRKFTPFNLTARFVLIAAAIVGGFCLLASDAPGDKSELSVTKKSRQQMTVSFQGKDIAVHHSGPALDKPYIHPLWTPDRCCVTYDAPADHLHHRALCVGWPDVSGTDFWGETIAPPGKRGQILTGKVLQKVLPNGGVTIVEKNRWNTQDGSELVRGEHSWIFLPPQGNLQLVDVELKLKATANEAVFGSDPGKPREYHGLTIRIGPFANPVYYNSAGDKGGQNCQGKSAKWCALSGDQHGRPVLTAILNSPANDPHPTRFYVQDRGMQFISSSPNFGKPKVLKRGETWLLRYRVVAAGKPKEGETWDLDALWNEYAKEETKR